MSDEYSMSDEYDILVYVRRVCQTMSDSSMSDEYSMPDDVRRVCQTSIVCQTSMTYSSMSDEYGVFSQGSSAKETFAPPGILGILMCTSVWECVCGSVCVRVCYSV